MSTWILVLAMFGAVITEPLPTARITVKYDKHTDFRTLRTYTWTSGWSAFRPSLDRQIVALVDRELAAHGFSRCERKPCDVLVAYRALQRTEVGVHDHRDGKAGVYPEYPVGSLMILMLEGQTRRELFRVRADMPVDIEIKLDEQIDSIVSRMFARYPTH
jgi:hypothetical protein